MDDIFIAIERETGLTGEQIRSNCRKEEIVYARRIVCWCLNKARKPFGSIGNAVNRDKSTVRSIIRQHASEYQYNKKYRAMFDNVMRAMMEIRQKTTIGNKSMDIQKAEINVTAAEAWRNQCADWVSDSRGYKTVPARLEHERRQMQLEQAEIALSKARSILDLLLTGQVD